MTVQRELDVEGAVRARYSGAARSPEASLCCPTNYPKQLLRAIPEEVLARDYGCGNPSVLYKGPFSEVRDDDGHVFPRGVPIAVCEKTFGILSQIPYRAHFELVPPHALEPLDECQPFPCNTGPIRRDPRETKGEGYLVTTGVRSLCPDDGSCC
jgi:hypothetical protein